MRLSFVLAVIAAFKLTVSMPAADGRCAFFCESKKCCPGYECVRFINDLLLSARLLR
ncbi:hypothetical protein BDR03DRAFT_959147 [Suillus americanus]|nr:hypothetical protein BDR03DRAFT_959147 [Suillus americanus]